MDIPVHPPSLAPSGTPVIRSQGIVAVMFVVMSAPVVVNARPSKVTPLLRTPKAPLLQIRLPRNTEKSLMFTAPSSFQKTFVDRSHRMPFL